MPLLSISTHVGFDAVGSNDEFCWLSVEVEPWANALSWDRGISVREAIETVVMKNASSRTVFIVVLHFS